MQKAFFLNILKNCREENKTLFQVFDYQLIFTVHTLDFSYTEHIMNLKSMY